MGNAIGNVLGGYKWIDNVLLDGMDYFAGIFYFFNHWAYRLAFWIMLVGLFINAIKLLFGAEAIKKVAVGTLGKLLVFGLIFFNYNLIVATVANTALDWGSNSGGGRGTVTSNLISLREQAEHDLKIARTLSAKREKMSKDQIKAEVSKMSKNYRAKKAMGRGTGNKLVADLVDKDGLTDMFSSQANIYKPTDEVIAFQEKTLQTLEGLLVPTKMEDKDGNLIDTYFLATTLIDRKGNPTYYISPAAFMKVAYLTGALIWQRQADYVSIKYNETLEDAEERTKGDWVKFPALEALIETYTISTLFNFVLCFICQMAIFICAIMALIQYIMTFFEYALVTSIVVFYTPFYLADITKQITSKLFPIFWNFFIKLMVITICMWFSLSIYINLASDQMGTTVPFDAMAFLTTLFSILISFIVTQSSPKISQTIISGNPELSMGEFLAAGATMYGAQQSARALAGKAAGVAARPAGRAIGEARATGAKASQAAKAAGGGKLAQVGAGIAGGAFGFVSGGVKGSVKEAGRVASGIAGGALFTQAGSQAAGARFKDGMAEGATKAFGKSKDKDEDKDKNKDGSPPPKSDSASGSSGFSGGGSSGGGTSTSSGSSSGGASMQGGSSSNSSGGNGAAK